MKTAQQWLAEYGASHRNPRNKLTHWLGIPLILFSVVAAFKAVPLGSGWLNAATVMIALTLAYYAVLSVRLALGMAVVFALFYAGAVELQGAVGSALIWAAIGIFVIGWVLQFVGHVYEGAKPSFFKDLQFLMIGPLWLMADLYRRLHLPTVSTSGASAG